MTRFFFILTVVCGLVVLTIFQNCSDTESNNDKSISVDLVRKKCISLHSGFRTDTINLDRLNEIDTIFFKKYLDGYSVIGNGCGRTILKRDQFTTKWVFYDFNETNDNFLFSIIENISDSYFFYFVIVDKKDNKIKGIIKSGCYYSDSGVTELAKVQLTSNGFLTTTNFLIDTWEYDEGYITRYDSIITVSELFKDSISVDTTTFFTRTDTILYAK